MDYTTNEINRGYGVVEGPHTVIDLVPRDVQPHLQSGGGLQWRESESRTILRIEESEGQIALTGTGTKEQIVAALSQALEKMLSIPSSK